MKQVNYISFVIISAVILFGAMRVSPTMVFAEDVVILPSLVGSDSPEPVVPAATSSNSDDAGSTTLPVTGGSNGNDAGIIMPKMGGSNGNEGSPTTYTATTSVTGNGSIVVTCNWVVCPSQLTVGSFINFGITPDAGWKIVSYTQDGVLNDASNVSGGCGGNTTVCNIMTSVFANINIQAAFAPVDNNSTTNTAIQGGGGSYSSGGSSINPLFALAYTGTSSCPLISSQMKFGSNNNASDVSKLQAFLNKILTINLAVNGQFDQATENAVKAFQTKYMSDIMGPWGATQSSGFVYITTMKQINKLACNSPLTLSADEMSIIDAYKARLAEEGSSISIPEAGPVLEIGSDTNSTSTDIGLSADGSQTAAAANTSILGKFWDFILSLFR